jgi:hypothetical protein
MTYWYYFVLDLFPKPGRELNPTAFAKLLFISQTLVLHGVFCSGAVAISFPALAPEKHRVAC